MLNTLPPRLMIFVRHVTYALVGYLAAVGANALYEGAKPRWPILFGFVAGSALGALTRKVPVRDER